MFSIATLLEFPPRKKATKDRMLRYLDGVTEAAINGTLISRHSNLISSNSADFRYWLQHYYDKFSRLGNNNIFNNNLPIAVILHSIIALKFQLSRDTSDDMPLYNLTRDGKILYINDINRFYYSNLYHVLLEITFIYFIEKNNMIKDVFLYYYYIFILQRSPTELYMKNQPDKHKLDDIVYFINFLENEETVVPFNMVNTEKEIVLINILAMVNAYDLSIYKKNILVRHNFYNLTSYKLYQYTVYNIYNDYLMDAVLSLDAAKNVVSSDYYNDIINLGYLQLSNSNYVLTQSKTMRRKSPAKSYIVINNKDNRSVPANVAANEPANLAPKFVPEQLIANNRGVVNIAIPRILLQRHIAQYGLIYTEAEAIKLYTQLSVSADSADTFTTRSDLDAIEFLIPALIIKMGLPEIFIYTLAPDFAIATILSGVVPNWPTQNIASILDLYNEDSYELKYRHDFIQRNYLTYFNLFQREQIDITGMRNVLQSTNLSIFFEQGYYNTSVLMDKYDDIVFDFASYLPTFAEKAIMQAPLNHFVTDYDIVFPFIPNHSFNVILKLPYIYFTLNNQQLCDKFNLANIYPRNKLFELISYIMKLDDVFEFDAYSRLKHYKLGDGKLYDHQAQKDIIVDVYSGEKFTELLNASDDSYNSIIILGLIYALNLFPPDISEKFNETLGNHDIDIIFET